MTLPPLPEPIPPNEAGTAPCIVKWMLETPAGWIGSWHKEAIPFVQNAAYQQGLKAGRDSAREDDSLSILYALAYDKGRKDTLAEVIARAAQWGDFGKQFITEIESIK